eukprot:TRINITY_DN51570_c0_g1_i1.p1 TRINITY_DN51570_c0_g1~~TRINITY_DN51570_c0_g1_i1.p1  ORF type:complete len:1343 (-),score=254.58 TRINITY_DN51570_c0_g1_i1:65-4093(-)
MDPPEGIAPDLKTVINALRSQPLTYEVQSWGCAAIRNITEDGGPTERSRALELGALELVVAALKQHTYSAQVQECACAALAGLTKDGNAWQRAIELGSLELVIDAMRDHPAEEEVQRWSLSSLAELLRHGEGVGAQAARGGCLELVIVAMQLHPSAPQVQACACTVLGRLALLKTSATGISVADIDAQARVLILGALREHVEAVEVQACGCAVLGTLALRGPQGLQGTLVVECDALGIATTALRQHQTSAAVQERASSALRCLVSTGAATSHPAFATRALELDAARLLSEALQQHIMSVTVQTSVLSALFCLASMAADGEEQDTVSHSLPALKPPCTPQVCSELAFLQALHHHPKVATVQDCGLALLWGRLVTLETIDETLASQGGRLASQALVFFPASPRIQTLACGVLNCCLPLAWLSFDTADLDLVTTLLNALRLHLRNLALQELGWAVLLKILQVGSLTAFASVQISDVFQLLTEAMELHLSSGLMQRTCFDCIASCCGSQGADANYFKVNEFRDSLLQLGAQHLIARGLVQHSEDLDLQESGCSALQALAENPEALLSEDGHGQSVSVQEALLALLHASPASVGVQIRGLDLLMALVPVRQRKGPGILLPGLDLALRALHHHQEIDEVVLIAGETLARLLFSDPPRGEMPEPMENIVSVMASMEGRMPSLSTKTILRNIARSCADTATRLVAIGGVEIIVQVMSAKSDLAGLQEVLLCILETLAVRCAPARGLLSRKAYATEAVLNAMKLYHQNPTIQARGCALLAHLAADGDQATRHLGNSGCLVQVITAMQTHADDSEVGGWGCIALQNLCCGGSPSAKDLRRQAANMGALETILDRMEKNRAAAPPPRSKTADSNASASTSPEEEQAKHSAQMVNAICVSSLHCFMSDGFEEFSAKWVSRNFVQPLTFSLDPFTSAFEIRERACHLLCQMCNACDKMRAEFTAAGNQLLETILATFREHLAAAVHAEDSASVESSEAPVDVLLSLPSPCNVPSALLLTSENHFYNQADDEGCRLRAMHVSSPLFIVQVMKVMHLEPRTQAAGCEALRRLSLLAARGLGQDCSAMIHVLPQAVELVVTALQTHDRSAQVQSKSVSALQALLVLSTSSAGEGEVEAIDRLVRLGAVPSLVRALKVHPVDAELQEHGLDVLRILATAGRRPDVLETLPEIGVIPAIIEAMNLNTARPKINEYGCSLLAEIAWHSEQRQEEVIQSLGVETVLRSIKAFPGIAEVLVAGFAAVQALASGNDKCKDKIFAGADILDLVTKGMSIFPKVEGVQAFGLAALLSLCHNKRERIEALHFLNVSSLAESSKVSHLKSKRVQEWGDDLIKLIRQNT